MNFIKKHVFAFAVVLFLSSFAFAHTASAATFYYNNAASDGDWSNTANWWQDAGYTIPGSVPGPADDVFIAGDVTGGVAAFYSATATAGTLAWTGVDVNNQLVLTGSASISGGTFGGDTGKIILYGSSTLSGTINASWIILNDNSSADGAEIIIASGPDIAGVDFFDTAHATGVNITASTIRLNDSSFINDDSGGNITANMVLRGNSYYAGPLAGNATFYDSSNVNNTPSAFTGNVDVFYPVDRSMLGVSSIFGTLTYHGYDSVLHIDAPANGTTITSADWAPSIPFLDTYNFDSVYGLAYDSPGFTEYPLTTVIPPPSTEGEHTLYVSFTVGVSPLTREMSTSTFTYAFAARNLYYNAAVDSDWDNLANWWKDADHTVPATALPDASSTVYVTGNLDSISLGDRVILVDTLIGTDVNLRYPLSITSTNGFTFNGASTNEATLVGDIVAYDTSSISGVVHGNIIMNDMTIWDNQGYDPLYGSATFNDHSQNQNTISNDAMFNDFSVNSGYVMQNATFACTATNSGDVGVTIIQLPCAPTISSITSTPSQTSSLISWSLTDAASSSVSYGLTTSYGSITATSSATAATLSSLSCGTTYNFLITSLNGGGATTSPNQTFTTSACASSGSSSGGGGPTGGGGGAVYYYYPPITAPKPNATSTATSTVGKSLNPNPLLIISNNVRDLQLGGSGADVKKLQQVLNALGFTIAKTGAGSPGKETTTFGSLTKQALIKFQKAYGITPAQGYFGPKTKAVMKGLGF